MTEGHQIVELTSIGTGTTKTRLNGDKAVKMPEGARTLLGIKPRTLAQVVTAAEYIAIKIEVDSDDVHLKPYEIPSQLVGSTLGLSGITLSSPVEFWPIYAKLEGGENINVYGTALTANTSAQYAGAELIYSDEPLWMLRKQLKAKMGTVTTMAAATAGITNGTPYLITGCDKLKEIWAAHLATTVAASKGVAGYLDFVSSEFESSFPQQIVIPASHGALSVDGAGTASNNTPIVQLARELTNMGIKPAGTTIADTYKLELALTTAGVFISGVLAEVTKKK